MVDNLRKIRKIRKSIPTIEGAGVHLKRAFGFQHVPAFDPFLLFDEFRSEKPEEYSMGFPWHPHRGGLRPSLMSLREKSDIRTAWETVE